MNDPLYNQPPGYVPPQVWTQKTVYGGAFGSSNRPVSGTARNARKNAKVIAALRAKRPSSRSNRLTAKATRNNPVSTSESERSPATFQWILANVTVKTVAKKSASVIG